MSRNHHVSLELETQVRRALNCGRFGLGGVADADFIDYDGGAYVALVAALAPYYVNADNDQRREISAFIEKYGDLRHANSGEQGDRIHEAANELKSLLDRFGV